MPTRNDCLGICFFNNVVFYAVNDITKQPTLRHIGAIDFNFDVEQALTVNHKERVQHLQKSIHKLVDRFKTERLRILHHAKNECWCILPKLIYDNADEREAYINILTNGRQRSDIQPVWHNISKDHFKLLKLRTRASLRGLQAISSGLPDVDFASAFNIGRQWITHAHPGGSFLTICVFDHCISVSSFILGKLRGATILGFEDIQDLSYLWLQKARHLPWLNGLHEQIQVYGQHAHRIIEVLGPFWDDSANITKMDSLSKMQVQASEQTYGFDLSLAYPAIMLAIGKA